MFEQNLQLPASGFGDLLMAGVALAMGFWTYRFGPSNSRTMLRLWVMAFLFLFLGGVLGAILEFTSNTMSDRDKLTGQLFLAAMYMLAGMFQLFGVHEAVDIGKWNKDLIFGVTGTAFVVLLVSAIVYEHPGLKMYFLLLLNATKMS